MSAFPRNGHVSIYEYAVTAAWTRIRADKKSGMRLAEHGATTHELMAISGHKTLSEVDRYTQDADGKRLATSAMAKRQAQSTNSKVANLGTRSGKPAAKLLTQNS